MEWNGWEWRVKWNSLTFQTHTICVDLFDAFLLPPNNITGPRNRAGTKEFLTAIKDQNMREENVTQYDVLFAEVVAPFGQLEKNYFFELLCAVGTSAILFRSSYACRSPHAHTLIFVVVNTRISIIGLYI